MTEPTVLQRAAFGREKRFTATPDGLTCRGGRHETVIRYGDVHRLRLSRTWMTFNRSHLRWTIDGAGRRMAVSLTTDGSGSAETAAFAAFIETCLDRVTAARPEVAIVIGMHGAWWLLWLGTFGILLAGLAAVAATMLDDGSLLAQGPPVLALIAGAPACWRNVHDGRSKRVSGAEMRAWIRQLGLGALSGPP